MDLLCDSFFTTYDFVDVVSKNRGPLSGLDTWILDSTYELFG